MEGAVGLFVLPGGPDRPAERLADRGQDVAIGLGGGGRFGERQRDRVLDPKQRLPLALTRQLPHESQSALAEGGCR